MSLWLQSLNWCLSDAKNVEKRARCIFAHLSMNVPRVWWESSLKTGIIPDVPKFIIMDMFDELSKIPILKDKINLSLLIALAFAGDKQNNENNRTRMLGGECSINEYIEIANKVLSDHPEIRILESMIHKM